MEEHMKQINTVDAVGQVLCHDLTRIVPGEFKDAAFRKGHIVTEEDIPVLLSMGKEHLFVWENDDTVMHEDDAAEVLCAICLGPHMTRNQAKEGKIEIFAAEDGIFEVDIERLQKINSIGDVIIATRGDHFPVKKGDKLAGMRVIPLVIAKTIMEKTTEAGGSEPLLRVKPYSPKKAAIIITGSEVFSGRIQDQFGPAIERKLKDFPVEIIGKTIVGDQPADIAAEIKKYIAQGADMILCTGGMSVDPDDTTPTAIKSTGADIVSYGAPVLPGAMFLLAYDQTGVPIMGLPGCVMYSKRTIFDLMLPRIMSDETITKEDLSALGHGGLCLDCETCIYPNCGFGKV
jgi:molybdenum cofactor synthesis domain-containing protein